MSTVSSLSAAERPSRPLPPFPLRVSENQRFLADAEGEPFFYLGDTAWELFHRLDRADTEYYLKNRADKGFSVIQAVVLAEEDGLRVPNRNGDLPLIEEDPTRPNEAYFQHVDWVVNRAAELGLVIGMLPTWGDKWNKAWGKGPEVFTPENARVYGEFLGRRYKDAPIIWILGGDRPIDNDTHRAVIEAMAEGLDAGMSAQQLMTYHNSGQRGSADMLHEAPWLDFNTYQSGHDYNRANWKRMAADYALSPTKPCLDAEPGYEDHPAGFKAANGFLDDYDTRKFAYWAVLAGAMGHTYGCHDIWQFNDPALWPPKNSARTHWRPALDLPGAGQMRHLRALMESRPYFTRVPDPELLEPNDRAREGGEHMEATRDDSGSYALVYLPRGGSVSVATGRLSGAQLRVSWLNPRSGELKAEEQLVDRTDTATFTAPSAGDREDWVLVLDDAGKR